MLAIAKNNWHGLSTITMATIRTSEVPIDLTSGFLVFSYSQGDHDIYDQLPDRTDTEVSPENTISYGYHKDLSKLIMNAREGFVVWANTTRRLNMNSSPPPWGG